MYRLSKMDVQAVYNTCTGYLKYMYRLSKLMYRPFKIEVQAIHNRCAGYSK
jgi:hypothetical protein